jgi:polyhydroxyalkanoate synthesis regulator phasin
MRQIIQKTLLAGVGATVVMFEAIESGLKLLVQRGKTTADEAKHTAEEIIEKGRQQAKETGSELSKRATTVLHKANVVTQDQFLTLDERLRLLEQKVFAQEAPHKTDQRGPG